MPNRQQINSKTTFPLAAFAVVINFSVYNRSYHAPIGQRVYRKSRQAFLTAANISTANCDEMAGDKPIQSAYEIFSIKRRL